MISYESAGLDAVFRKIAELDNGPEVQDEGEIRVETRDNYVIVSWRHVKFNRWVIYVGSYTQPTMYYGIYDGIDINRELDERGFLTTNLRWIHFNHYPDDYLPLIEWLRKNSYHVILTRDLAILYALDSIPK